MKAIILALLLLAGAGIYFYVSSDAPVLTVDSVKVIGNATPLNVHVEDPHGIRRLDVEVRQDGKSYSATSV